MRDLNDIAISVSDCYDLLVFLNRILFVNASFIRGVLEECHTILSLGVYFGMCVIIRNSL